MNEFVQAFSSASGKTLKHEEASFDEKMMESNYLYLNSDKAKQELRWEPIFDLEQTIQSTIEWELESEKSKPRKATLNQVVRYLKHRNIEHS